MKRTTKIFVALLTFAFGCLAFYAFNFAFSFQTIVNYKDFFEGRTVRIETHLSKFKKFSTNEDSWIVGDIDCQSDLACGADLDLSNYKEDFNFNKLSEELIQLNDDSNALIFPNAKVIVTGKLHYKLMHCFTLPFTIEVEQIEQIAPAENLVLPEKQ